MNAVEIEEAVSLLVSEPFDRAEFPFQFLEAFGNKQTTIQRLRKGSTNRTDVDGAVLQSKNVHILATEPGEVETGLIALRESPKTVKQKAKFIFATDGQTISAEDLNSGETLDCGFTDLPTHFGFLLPLAGITTVSEIKNNPIDIKATGRLDKLYVALLQDERNKNWAQEKNRERFNHFMAQLIFCFFAEDTGIFRGDNLFTATVGQMSQGDPTLTQEIITNIFAAMNLDPRKGERKGVRPYADVFPYVNGGLFKDTGDDIAVPVFDKMARTYLIRAGELDWTAINPDIFGSMIQAVADDEERGELGMHYTSVPNILKVLGPLFLDSLNADLEKAGSNRQQLGKLKKRIERIRVFDPACGSGNFLVIAYKKMREIEHKANQAAGWETEKSVIPLTNFRGIELKSFAAEIARLALIIAEYQCDELYMGQREALALFLPLEKTNWITCENALRVDWLKICPPTGETKVSIKLTEDDLFKTPKVQSEIDFENEGGETYICGNPPYLGSTWQSKAQKDDLKQIFDGRTKSWKSLDYVAGWFMKGADYLTHTDGVCAFVSTNSICQGQQVPILWPLIFATGNEIVFAHTSFKWRNLATHNAGVTTVIVGVSESSSKGKRIFELADDNELIERTVQNVNPYLVAAPNVIVEKLSKPFNEELSHVVRGNIPVDGGGLYVSSEERKQLPDLVARNVIRLCLGSAEFISGKLKYCLWIEDKELKQINSNEFVARRLSEVSASRLKSSKAATRAAAVTPHKFFEKRQSGRESLLAIPAISSENRPYLPVGLLEPGTIITGKMYGVFDAPLWNMALIASRLHWVWIGTVCVRMRTDFSYSNTLGWNTFPVPKLTTKNKSDLTAAAENILLAREAHFPATIADLYKPKSEKHAGMPENLRIAHEENDSILEEIYIGRRFKNDTERLEKLFEMYTEMTSKVGA